jgi:hypothetical protein
MDGNSMDFGPDIWNLQVESGPTLINTTFNNHYDFTQAYPDEYPGESHPAGTGAAETGTLGYYWPHGSFHDAVYSLTFRFPHRAETVVFRFSGNGLQSLGDESWGIDNLLVRIVTGSNSIYNPANNHWYQRIDDTRSWHMAKAHCESLEGYLVTITSQVEQDFVFDNLVSNSQQNCWLGATDQENEGNWQWVTGENWDFVNWDTSQPDNCNELEHYAALAKSDGVWHDKVSLNNGSGGCDCPVVFENMSTICEWGETQPIPGDFDGDGAVTHDDLSDHFLPAYGKKAGEPGYVAEYDLNQDGIIDMIDYAEWYEFYMDANP